MPETDDTTISVSLAEIARIAGVGRAAVSNWRRRYDSFPTPVGGTDTSPQFSLSQVERWLRQNKKFRSPVGSLERLWPKFDILGDRESMGRIIAAVGLGSRKAVTAPEFTLAPAEQALLDESLAVAQEEGTAEVFRFLLDRWLTAHVRQIATTPIPLSRLMVEIADATGPGRVRAVLDPACGSGTLLVAAGEHWKDRPLRLAGQDEDAVLAAVAAARLHIEQKAAGRHQWVEISAGDSLRAGTHADDGVDAVLCNPPTGERDWGHAELVADPRWEFGLPPRSEPELAWVQEVIASLGREGTGVLLLPPTVASRRAGRRIRDALLRWGALRALVALPAGAAAPYGVGLHLWVVRRPTGHAEEGLLLIDTGDCRSTTASGRPGIDWDAVRKRVLGALRGDPVDRARVIPVIELLDDLLDLSPARHVASTLTAADSVDLREEWSAFETRLGAVTELSRALASLAPSPETVTVSVSVAELERAGALTVRTGRPVPEHLLGRGERPADAVPVLTLRDLLAGDEPSQWVLATDVVKAEDDGPLTVADPGDVVVIGVQRAFDARVRRTEPAVLGAQLLAIRPGPDLIDPWYLAGCLRTPANVRRAGGHASTSSRIDVRRLEVLRLPLEAQRRYGELFREMEEFEGALRELAEKGMLLRTALGELLATGRLPVR